MVEKPPAQDEGEESVPRCNAFEAGVPDLEGDIRFRGCVRSLILDKISKDSDGRESE